MKYTQNFADLKKSNEFVRDGREISQPNYKKGMKNMATELKEINLSSEEIKELGYRLQATSEILDKFIDSENKHVIELVNKEISEIASTLTYIDDKESLNFLLKS